MGRVSEIVHRCSADQVLLGVWRRAGRVGDPAGGAAVVDIEGGKEHGGAGALVLELSASRLPGRAGLVGLMQDLACMPDLSSTLHTTAFWGGFR